MKKALIIVQSKDKTTRKFGEEIAEFLLYRGLSAELIPVSSFEPNKLKDADYLLVSGWRSSGLFSFKDKDKDLEMFVDRLPALNGIKTALFTTYKFSGSIFRKMKKYLNEKSGSLEFLFKSNDGSLSVSDKLAINDFIR